MSSVFNTVVFPQLFLTGTTAPADSLGIPGQIYIRKDTTNRNLEFYGPKTFSGWGTPVNMVGKTIQLQLNSVIGVGNPQDTSLTFIGNDTYLLSLVLPPGIPGPPGSAVVLETIGQPADSVGNNGELAWDRTNKTMWGPKAGGTWAGTGVSLAPSKILNGNGAPTISDGDLYDYWINVANGDLYGPKLAGGWGFPIFNLGSGGVGGGLFLFSEEYTAAQNFSALRFFAVNNLGNAEIANCNNINHLGRVVGITLQSYMNGTPLRGITKGIIRDSSFVFPSGTTLFIDNNGKLTDTFNIDTAAFIQIVGRSVSPGEVFIDIENAVRIVR